MPLGGAAERRADLKIGRARHLHAQINTVRAGEVGAFAVAVSVTVGLHIFAPFIAARSQDKQTSCLVQKQGELGCSGRIGKKDIPGKGAS